MKNLICLALVSVFAVLSLSACQPKCAKPVPIVKEEAVLSVVNVPNPNGSMTPVMIRRVGNVWVGPNGEVYSTYPTADQLKPIYGLNKSRNSYAPGPPRREPLICRPPAFCLFRSSVLCLPSSVFFHFLTFSLTHFLTCLPLSSACFNLRFFELKNQAYPAFISDWLL